MTTYIGKQKGRGIGSDALQWVKENPDKVAKKVYENRAKIFQYTSNAQRFVSKNIKKNPKPIRYLKEGEIHLPNHNFTGPATKISLPEVRNHQPYNNIDACSKVHDIEFNEIFKMPLGKQRSEKIRQADRKVLECYDKYPNESGYRLAKTGINSKIRLEDLSPSIFDSIMGQDYRGVEPELKKPKRKCKGQNRKKCLSQQGGMLIDPISGYLLATTPVALGMLYGEYRLGKTIYDKLRENGKQRRV
jgi:hypothetical protein